MYQQPSSVLKAFIYQLSTLHSLTKNVITNLHVQRLIIFLWSVLSNSFKISVSELVNTIKQLHIQANNALEYLKS